MFPPQPQSNQTLRQSKHMPYWLYFIVAKSLGIKTHEKDKPWFATFLYCLMLTSMFLYLICTGWYVVFDIQAVNTKYDVLNGTITLMMACGFSAISIYANKLAYKLFTNRIFLQSVRLHSKTVLSLNASMVLAVIGAMFLGLYSYQTVENIDDDFCIKIGVSPWICRFRWPSQLGLAITSFAWNAMVASVMLSVCRTHTISIRHFILILEEDSLVYELKRSRPADGVDGATPVSPSTPDALPPDIDDSDKDLKNLEDQWDQSEIQRRRRSVSGHFQSLYTGSSINSAPSIQVDIADGDIKPSTISYQASGATEYQEPRHSQQTLAWLNASGYSNIPMNKMLSNEDILDKYWKLQARLRTTSMIIQRWLSTWIVLILFWSTYYLLYWIDHDATILDMVIFFVPLVLLPVLCSGPTEVNGEGHRVPRSIVPTEERLRVIAFIKQSPLSITIFGFELNYATIVSTMAAIALAFATKVIITNIQVHPDTTDMTPTGVPPP